MRGFTLACIAAVACLLPQLGAAGLMDELDSLLDLSDEVDREVKDLARSSQHAPPAPHAFDRPENVAEPLVASGSTAEEDTQFAADYATEEAETEAAGVAAKEDAQSAVENQYAHSLLEGYTAPPRVPNQHGAEGYTDGLAVDAARAYVEEPSARKGTSKTTDQGYCAEIEDYWNVKEYLPPPDKLATCGASHRAETEFKVLLARTQGPKRVCNAKLPYEVPVHAVFWWSS